MARLPEDKQSLTHLMPGYDPVKAHEYYMRMRKLHPRQQGMGRPIVGRTGSTATRTPLLAKPAAQQLLRQRAAAAAAVKSLETKLVELKNVLQRKKAALNRDKKLQANPTAATKAKAARQSKQYRQSHKQVLKQKAQQAAAKSSGGKSASSPAKNVIGNPKSGSIKEVEAAIQTVEKALTAAKARQQALG